MTTPTVSVVVPTFRRPEALDATLAALDALNHPADRLQVIVVDDGSGDRTPDVVAAHPRATYVSQRNGGAAKARNHGARGAMGELLLFVDDDILVEPSHLSRHIAVHGRHDRALVNGEWEFAPATVAALQATPFGRYRLALEEQFRREVQAVALPDGCLRVEITPSQDLSLDRELFWEIGGFDESFPAAGAEDQEFSYRASDNGCILLRDPSIQLLHNDARVTLEQFCRREERSAATIPHLARRYPSSEAAVSYLRVNGPAARADGARLVLVKAAKVLLAREPMLTFAYALVRVLERLRLSDAVLARAYSTLAGLHIFRGVRAALSRR
jgi:GT2 family glycosyltransferase